MKQSDLNVTESDLQAYVDGHLEADRAEQVTQYLEQHPEEAKRIRAYQEQNQLLHTLYEKDDLSLLKRVNENFRKSNSAKRRPLANLAYATAATWLIVGLTVGWGLNEVTSPHQDIVYTLPHTALVAHSVFSPEVRHPVEVTANQEAHLVKWLSKRLNRKLKTPNLNPLGYALVGGRLLPAQNGPAAQFMYENKNGARLTLYIISQSSKNTAFKFFERNDIKVFSWADTNMGFAIVGSISKDQLLRAATHVYNELDI